MDCDGCCYGRVLLALFVAADVVPGVVVTAIVVAAGNIVVVIVVGAVAVVDVVGVVVVVEVCKSFCSFRSTFPLGFGQCICHLQHTPDLNNSGWKGSGSSHQ